MNHISINLFKNILLCSALLFCNIANAENITVATAKNHPYKDLINRTDKVKIFYIMNNKNVTCKVEVVLGKIKWVSTNKKVSNELFNNDPLSSCLSREKAKEILFRTFLEFGRGL